MIEHFARNIPRQLRDKSGSVFYSGRGAFSGPCPLYILGLNPGGDPVIQKRETVEWHTRKVLEEKPAVWSEYTDESWGGSPPGRHGMQPRVTHLLSRLGLHPGKVPASNLIFLRSGRGNDIADQIEPLTLLCWPFHQAVIKHVEPRVILCFGRPAGNQVKRNTGALVQVDEFVERYPGRSWASCTFVNAGGLKVVVASHPSIAAWTTPEADPSELVRRALSM